MPGSIFNWTDTASGTSILMLLHPRGYGVSFDEETGERFGHENPCPTATDMVNRDIFFLNLELGLDP